MADADDTITFVPVWNEPPYTVKYAVRIYGIKQDENEAGNKIGLTFGPAGGYGDDFIYTPGKTKYRCHDESDSNCIHNMTWEQIVQAAKTNPEQFQKCLEYRCTKAVPFNITGPIKGSEYKTMDEYDGASSLYNSIASSYRQWNPSNDTTGGWRDSKVRNTLTGATNDAIVSHGGTLTEEESLYAMLPKVLKDNIVPKKVISATSYEKTSELAITYDTLWLFSTVELYKHGGHEPYGSSRDDREGELYQSQEYLDAVGTNGAGSTTVNRFYYEIGTYDYPWSRSLYSSSYAVHFNYNGYPGRTSPSYTNFGLAPGFCIG